MPMMSYKDFEEAIISEMNQQLFKNKDANGLHAEILNYKGNKVISLMDCSRDEFFERMKKYKAYAAGSISLKDLYIMYFQWGSLQEVVNESVSILLNKPYGFEADDLVDYSYVKDHMILRCENSSRFILKASNILHYDFHDISCYIQVQLMIRSRIEYVDITYEVFENLNISKEQLLKDALISTNRLLHPFYINEKGLEAYDNYSHPQWFSSDEDKNSIFIISNLKYLNGASAMFNPYLLNALSKDCRGNFYIVPVCDKFLMVFPEYLEKKTEELYEFLDACNEASEEKNKLSEYVYYFDSDENSLHAVDKIKENEKANSLYS